MGDVSLHPPISAELLPVTICKGDQFLDLMSDVWTNERHNLYISSMEASFMDQLYGNEHHGLDRKRVLPQNVCNNLRSERNDAHAHDEGMSCFPQNPCTRRFRPRNAGVNCKNEGVGFSMDDDESGTDMVRERVRVHGKEVKNCVGEFLADKSTEVSDQNFPDEDTEVVLYGKSHAATKAGEGGGAVKPEGSLKKMALESC
uniref:Uncharacterized protein n=1 Tax=Leersia perrieri TaxID=77586 RepID=A0A0D9XJ84_9ORYZ